MTDQEIRQLVWTLEWQCYGEDRGDADYWVSKWPELVQRGGELGDPNYAQERVMGRGAGGGDVPKFGPFSPAQAPFYAPVPPYPGAAAPVAPPVPAPVPPAATVDLAPILTAVAGVRDAIASLKEEVEQLRSSIPPPAAPISFPDYVGKFSFSTLTLSPRSK